ncbi:hypothetical protein ACI0X9_003269 [Cronobacter turicensis]
MDKLTASQLLSHYLNRPLLLWCGLLSAFFVAQLLLGRNNGEAIKFLLAAVLCSGVHLFYTKTKKRSLISLLIFLIPSACIALYAAVVMPKETTVGDYTEIAVGLKFAKQGVNKNEILLAVMDAMDDGMISQWESQDLRHLIYEKNGFLMRSDAANYNAVSNTADARQNLQIMINQLKPHLENAQASDKGK